MSYTYDSAFNRLATMTDGTGVTAYDYYPAGVLGALMPKTVDGPLTGSTDLITFTYDALGRLQTNTIGTGNLVTLNFDSLSRLQSIINPLGTFSHSYVGDTHRTDHMDYPNGQRTSFSYFPAIGDNRLQSITHLANATNPSSTLSKFDYTYQKDGNIATWQKQLGVATANQMTLGYDPVDQLTSATVSPVSNLNSITNRYSYQYDKAGNRSSEQNGNAVSSATHNTANRLTNLNTGGKMLVAGNTNEPAKVKVNGQSASVTAPPENLYQAWIQVTPGPNTLTIVATDYAAPTPNVRTKSWSINVTSPSARSFTYDTNGNTLSDGLRTYQWDAENRLVKITQGANVYEFTFDGLSRRVTEKVNSTLTRRWLWNGTQIAEERDAAGTTIKKRYYSQGEQRLGGADAGSYFYTRDHLGSIREITDSTATVRARYDYDPYGKRTKLSGDLDCDFAFTGHYYHAATSLHLTLFRAYDADLGRWLSADPIGEAGGLNLYRYVGGDPVNLVDLYGLEPIGTDSCENPDRYTADNRSSVSGWDSISRWLRPFKQKQEALQNGKRIDMVFWPIEYIGPSEGNGSLSQHKEALKKVQDIVGKLAKGQPGKFGSPQAGCPEKGYRLDPGHPKAPKGSPEEGPHINWWDYTKGKRGKGGESGAIPIIPKVAP